MGSGLSAAAQGWPDESLGRHRIADLRAGPPAGPAFQDPIGRSVTVAMDRPCAGCELGCAACADPLYHSISADFLWLGRSRVLDDVPFDVKAGIHASYRLGEARGPAFELGYLGVSHQPGELFFDSGGDTFYLSYESHLHTVDFNCHFDPWGRLTPMFGVRWIHQAENYEIEDVATPTSMLADAVRNDLLGAQVGLQLSLWDHGGWFRCELMCKAGVYHNEINLRSDFQIAGAALNGHRLTDAVSYASEVHLSGVCQISRQLLFRAGYVGLWLTDMAAMADNLNVALAAAPWQLDRIDYHGGQLGFEARW